MKELDRDMTPELSEHLAAIEQAIQSVRALLSRYHYPDDLRTVVLAGLIDQMLEHQDAVLLLVRTGKVGSAFALARSIFEAMYRGMWINFCATDAQIKQFEKDDEIPLTLGQLAEAIDGKYRADGFFTRLKERGWKALCSYAHTGMLQLGRRFTDRSLQPAYREGEIFEITTAATTCVLVLVSRFFAVQNHPEASQQTDKLIESYGPTGQRNRNVENGSA